MMRTNTRPEDLDTIAEGQDAVLAAERIALLEDLRAGLSPLVCLSGPGERRRMVRLTHPAQVESPKLPWARFRRG
jgi:hypothetical protein